MRVDLGHRTSAMLADLRQDQPDDDDDGGNPGPESVPLADDMAFGEIADAVMGAINEQYVAFT